MHVAIDSLTGLVSACAALVGALGVLVLQVITLVKLNDERHRSSLRDAASSKRDATQAVILEHVNGLNDKISAASYAAGKAEGTLAGALLATASPTGSDPQTKE